MGREIKMKSTSYVRPLAIWFAYLSSFLMIYIIFNYNDYKLKYIDYLLNYIKLYFINENIALGFIAYTLSTITIWIFTFFYSNTSIYDPFWTYNPIPLSLCWLFNKNNEINEINDISYRSLYALFLLILWCSRYIYQHPWDGWFKGIETEDWRYLSIAEKTGFGTSLFWFVSLISLQLTPSYLVFFSLSPVESVWTTNDGNILTYLDLIAFLFTLGTIYLQHISDTALYKFRYKQYKKQLENNSYLSVEHLSSSKKICQDFPWNYSRHPNYLGECSFWLGMNLIAFAQDPSRNFLHTFLGGIIMFTFFRISAYLTDERMLKNRGKKYEEVMKNTAPLVPFVFI